MRKWTPNNVEVAVHRSQQAEMFATARGFSKSTENCAELLRVSTGGWYQTPGSAKQCWSGVLPATFGPTSPWSRPTSQP